jgi:HlyD family secretion protein
MTNGEPNTRWRRRTWLIIGATVVAVVFLASFISLGRKDVPVRAFRTRRQTITSNISTNGKIRPVANFEAHALAPTTVSHILVQEGDSVQSGQLLVQLDDLDARAQAAKAEAQLRSADADLRAVRQGGTQEEVLTSQSDMVKAQAQFDLARHNVEILQGLQQKGAASAGETEAAQERLQTAQVNRNLAQAKQNGRYSTPEIERVQAQADQARASLLAAQDILRHSDIRAPRAGTVYSLPIHQGQFVNPGDLLVQVADLSSVEVVGYVDEPDIGRLHSGEPVQVRWDALPGRTWEGSVTGVPYTVVAVGARTVGEITCRVNNSDLKLLPNINVNVSVVTAQAQDVIAIPREAVHAEDGQRFVFEIVNGVLRRRNVQTAISNLTDIEITQGLADGAQVALGPLNNLQVLQEGMQVRVVGQ